MTPVTVRAQYLKDLSFENPGAPQSLMQMTQAPNVQINVNVEAKKLSDKDYEVILHIGARPSRRRPPVPGRAGLCRHLLPGEHARGHDPAGAVDRGAAAPVPVRPHHRRRGDARGRLAAADHPADRFRRRSTSSTWRRRKPMRPAGRRPAAHPWRAQAPGEGRLDATPSRQTGSLSLARNASCAASSAAVGAWGRAGRDRPLARHGASARIAGRPRPGRSVGWRPPISSR